MNNDVSILTPCMIALVFVAYYFLLVRPEKNKKKKAQAGGKPAGRGTCSICGNSIGLMSGGRKLANGGKCCKDCIDKLSYWYVWDGLPKEVDIRNQLQEMELNKERAKVFNPTGIVHSRFNLYIDHDHEMFCVCNGEYKASRNVDIFKASQIIHVEGTIGEKKKEIRYKDSNGNIKSFKPPYFGYSYNFHVNIDLNCSYLDHIYFTLNPAPVDNDQVAVINLSSDGVLSKLGDALFGDKSYNNGQTANAAEVMASAEYQNYESLLDDMVADLEELQQGSRPKKAKKQNPIRCPWCGQKVPYGTSICPHCCGPIDEDLDSVV